MIGKTNVKLLINAFVFSRLDNLSAGALPHIISGMELIQDAAAHIIQDTHTHTSEHITPVLNTWHWLPVKSHFAFKVIFLSFTVPNVCVSSACQFSVFLLFFFPGQSLKLELAGYFVFSGCKLDSLGTRVLGNYAPQLWNLVPNEIKSCAISVIDSRPG